MEKSSLKNSNLNEAFDKKEVLFVDFITPDEVFGFSHADSRTIFNVLTYISAMASKVTYLSYRSFGVTGKLIGFFWKYKNGAGKSRITGKDSRWLLTLIVYMILHTFSYIDPSFKRNVRQKFSQYDVLIAGRPYFLGPIKSSLKNMDIKILLYEHNIEKRFFDYLLKNFRPKLLRKILTGIIQRVERSAIRKAETVLTVSNIDRKTLISDYPNSRVFRLFPTVQILVPPILNFNTLKIPDIVSNGLYEVTDNHINVMFLGSNYSLNVESVENLIIASQSLGEINSKIHFFIIGDVGINFVGRKNTPTNFIFTGYVRDLELLLGKSDLFVFYDLMRTGFETKALLYSSFQKRTILFTNSNDEYDDFFNGYLRKIRNTNEFVSEIKSIMEWIDKHPGSSQFFNKTNARLKVSVTKNLSRGREVVVQK
jgi:hypothetical protein